VSGRVAFHPETLTAISVLGERNAEVRRVMIERMGTERFIAAVQPQILNVDEDAGGPRRLLSIVLENDEPLVCLEVLDVHLPSSGCLDRWFRRSRRVSACSRNLATFFIVVGSRQYRFRRDPANYMSPLFVTENFR
jgi:hypothetical protein